MRILVTGAGGMLGHVLVLVLSRMHQVIPTTLREVDLTKPESVSQLGAYEPELIIHAAAYTDVDGAERHPELAWAVNAEGTRQVALACADLRIPCIYISTDYVFDGHKREPYEESDPPNPINVYGRTKLEGERHLQERVRDGLIVRSAWLYGPTHRNFVTTILAQAEKGTELKVVDDQVGSPTYTCDLAEALASLLAEQKSGIVHLINAGACTWYELAKTTLKYAGTSTVLTPISTADLQRPAPRPSYSVLRSSTLCPHLRSWNEALESFITAHQSSRKVGQE